MDHKKIIEIISDKRAPVADTGYAILVAVYYMLLNLLNILLRLLMEV